MNDFLRHWVVTAIALGVTAWVLPGVRVESLPALAVAAVVLGLLNATVKPLVTVLTLPLTVLTLGIFYLILNGAFFAVAAALVPGFEVRSLGWAVLAALVMGLVSSFVGGIAGSPADHEAH